MYVSRIHDMFISDINKQYKFQTMKMSDIWNANSAALYMTCDYLHLFHSQVIHINSGIVRYKQYLHVVVGESTRQRKVRRRYR
jgi:hypothetical protein